MQVERLIILQWGNVGQCNKKPLQSPQRPKDPKTQRPKDPKTHSTEKGGGNYIYGSTSVKLSKKIYTFLVKRIGVRLTKWQ